MVGTAIGGIGTAIEQCTVDQIFHRTIDGHLVHQRCFDQMPLGRGTARAKHRHHPPFRYLEAKAAFILARNHVADGVGRRR